MRSNSDKLTRVKQGIYLILSLVIMNILCIAISSGKLIYDNRVTNVSSAWSWSWSERVVSALTKVADKQVCVWLVSGRDVDMQQRLVKGLISSYKAVVSFVVDQVNIVPSLCRHNVLVTDESCCRDILSLSLPLTVDHHYYVIVLGSLPLHQLHLCIEQFGVARASFVSLVDTQVFSLSSPVLQNRTFFKSNLSSILNSHRITRVDLEGRPVNIATFNCTPFVIIKDLYDPDTYNGIEWHVVRSIAKAMNFTIRLVQLKGPALWGHLLENGSWSGGISRAAYDGEAEIGVCNLWFTRDMYRIMDFATPLNVIKFSFIAPRPSRSQHNWRALVQVFDVHVWILILLLYFFCSSSYWKFVKAYIQRRTKPELVKCFLTMFGVLMGTHWPSHTRNYGARLLVTLWCVFVLLLTSTYNTSIASRLTVQRYEQRVDTIRQLVEQDFRWSDEPENDFSKRSIYFNLANYWQRRWVQRYVSLPTSRMREALKKEKVVFPFQRWGDRLPFLLIAGIDVARDLEDFRAIKETTTNTFVSIMFTKRSPLYHPGQVVLLRVVQAGLINYWTSQADRSPQNKYLKRLLYEEKPRNSPKQLGLNNLWSVFCMLCVGLFTGLNVFLFECLCKRKPL